MSNVSVIFGPAQTFPATFTQTPVNVGPGVGTFPPQVTIYSDSARTIVVVATANLTATANPNVWLVAVPVNLAIGIYYLKFSASYSGTSYSSDSSDTLTVAAASVGVGTSSFAQVSDVRSSQSDTTQDPLAFLWTGLTDTLLLTRFARASKVIERRLQRRLLPFTRTAIQRAYPIDPDEVYGRRQDELLADGALDYGSTLPTTGSVIAVGPPLSLWVDARPGDLDEGWALSVTSIQVRGADRVLYAVDTSTVITEPRTGRVTFTRPNALVNNGAEATITYTAGFTSSPADLVEATILLAASTWLATVDIGDGQLDGKDLEERAWARVSDWASSHAKSGGIG